MVAPATVWLKPREGLNPVGCTTQPIATAAAADARAAKEKGNFAHSGRAKLNGKRTAKPGGTSLRPGFGSSLASALRCAGDALRTWVPCRACRLPPAARPRSSGRPEREEKGRTGWPAPRARAHGAPRHVSRRAARAFSGAQNGAFHGAQSGAFPGAQNGASHGAQSGASPGAQSGVFPGTRTARLPTRELARLPARRRHASAACEVFAF